MSQTSKVSRQKMRIGGIPLMLLTGAFDDVVRAFGEEIGDRSKAVFLLVDGASPEVSSKLLVIEEEFDGNVEAAKGMIPNMDLDRHFVAGFKAVNFIAALDGGIRYASTASGFARHGAVDHGVVLRKLGTVVFDAQGRVTGSANGGNTLFLYSQRIVGRTDFAWDGRTFRRVTFDLGRETVRHTVVGGRGVMVAEAGGNRALLATAEDIAAFVAGNARECFVHRLEIPGRVIDLALGAKAQGNAYSVVATTDRAFVPVQLAFRGGAPTVLVNLDRAVELDGTVRDLGGAVKITDSHVVFFGRAHVSFVPIAQLREPFLTFFRDGYSLTA